jgi:hypothetical protein
MDVVAQNEQNQVFFMRECTRTIPWSVTFPPTVAIPQLMWRASHQSPPTATPSRIQAQEPPKKVGAAEAPAKRKTRPTTPRDALARSARRPQLTERGVGLPRFPPTRRPRFLILQATETFSNLPFPILHLLHHSVLSPFQGQFRTCASSTRPRLILVVYNRTTGVPPCEFAASPKGKGQSGSCGWPRPPLLRRGSDLCVRRWRRSRRLPPGTRKPARRSLRPSARSATRSTRAPATSKVSDPPAHLADQI